MSLRRRLSLVAAAAVAVAVVLVACISYLVVRGQLRGQVDAALRSQALLVRHAGSVGLRDPFPGLPPSAGGRAPFAQVVDSGGTVIQRTGGMSLPVDAATQGIARGQQTAGFRDVTVDGEHLRVYAFRDAAQSPSGQIAAVAVELARPLHGVDHVLSRLRLILLVLLAGGVALAAALGRIAARRVLSPLAEVSQAAEHIGQTDDLSRRIAVHAEDEVGQLARRFNHMLERLQGSRAALDESVRAQRQLVADASHELRTPVTSLRTNIELLLANTHMREDERRRVLSDVVEQSEELTALVSDLIELARGDLPVEASEAVRLDGVVQESLARARRNASQVRFEAALSPAVLDGAPDRLGRAINNLLDNAARHSPPDGVVEVRADEHGVLVRDHGPGIDPEDLPYVFDRFFRGAHTRGQQGSGLGLAIVRQVAAQHGGSVSAANAADGGAVFEMRLPAGPIHSEDDPHEHHAAAPLPGATATPAGG